MPHARDEHGFSSFDESSFELLLKDYYNDLELRIPGTPITGRTGQIDHYQEFLREQVIIQYIIVREDEWKAHTGHWYSEDRRDRALKKNKSLSKLANGQAVLGTFFQKKLCKCICVIP